ncbi:MAG: autotransporter domain-containing protein [Bacteroidales bacterium]|jgi:hypothetical protein|nr:autotransporter domain-containing protein [Bacteroidales bacterium]
MKTLRTFIIFLFTAACFNANAQENTFNSNPYHNFSLDIGYGYRLANSPNELFTTQTKDSDYFNKVKHGLHISFNYDFRFKSYLEFGFKASGYNSAASLGDSVGSKDDLYIFYLGPTVKYNYHINSTNSVYARATIGYISFRNSLTEEIVNNLGVKSGSSKTYRGYNFGMGIEVGYDYKVNDYLSLGVSSAILGGSINKLKFGDQSFVLNKPECLFRFELGVGARIRI